MPYTSPVVMYIPYYIININALEGSRDMCFVYPVGGDADAIIFSKWPANRAKRTPQRIEVKVGDYSRV
jgi:hypothetical protein